MTNSLDVKQHNCSFWLFLFLNIKTIFSTSPLIRPHEKRTLTRYNVKPNNTILYYFSKLNKKTLNITVLCPFFQGCYKALQAPFMKLSLFFESLYLLFDHWLEFIAIRKNSKPCLFLNRLLVFRGVIMRRCPGHSILYASFLSLRITGVISAQLHMVYSEYTSGWARLVAHYHEPYFF